MRRIAELVQAEAGLTIEWGPIIDPHWGSVGISARFGADVVLADCDAVSIQVRGAATAGSQTCKGSNSARLTPVCQAGRHLLHVRRRTWARAGHRQPTFTFMVLDKGMPKSSSKNQITLPVEALRAAGIESGDEVTTWSIGSGETVIAARASRVRRHAGIAEGIYRPREIDQLRDEWDR